MNNINNCLVFCGCFNEIPILKHSPMVYYVCAKTDMITELLFKSSLHLVHFFPESLNKNYAESWRLKAVT